MLHLYFSCFIPNGCQRVGGGASKVTIWGFMFLFNSRFLFIGLLLVFITRRVVLLFLRFIVFFLPEALFVQTKF